MYQILYLSSAVKPFTDEELEALLNNARVANKKVNVTGLLVYHDGNFIQLLEGEEADVKAIFAKIKQDLRHRGIIELIDKDADARIFPEWSMGFKTLNSNDFSELKGYFKPEEVLDISDSESQYAKDAIMILKHFVSTNITKR
jgi:hypothetical protein